MMRTNATYTNEFTGEVFSDKNDCMKSEARSKTAFITKLIEDMELIKDICNSHDYCEGCPFDNNGEDACAVNPLADNYLNIVRRLQAIKN